MENRIEEGLEVLKEYLDKKQYVKMREWMSELNDADIALRACIDKQLFYNIGRHFLQKIRRIVRHQVIDDLCRFPFGKGCDNILFHFDRKIGKNIRSEYGQNVVMEILIPLEKKNSVEEKIVDITCGKTGLESVEEVFYAPVEGEVKIWRTELKKD